MKTNYATQRILNHFRKHQSLPGGEKTSYSGDGARRVWNNIKDEFKDVIRQDESVLDQEPGFRGKVKAWIPGTPGSYISHVIESDYRGNATSGQLSSVLKFDQSNAPLHREIITEGNRITELEYTPGGGARVVTAEKSLFGLFTTCHSHSFSAKEIEGWNLA